MLDVTQLRIYNCLERLVEDFTVIQTFSIVVLSAVVRACRVKNPLSKWTQPKNVGGCDGKRADACSATNIRHLLRRMVVVVFSLASVQAAWREVGNKLEHSGEHEFRTMSYPWSGDIVDLCAPMESLWMNVQLGFLDSK